MGSDRSVTAPYMKAAVATLGVGALVLAGRQLIGEEATGADTQPPNRSPWSSSDPSIRTFRLKTGECLVSDVYGSDLRIPLARYEIETPSHTYETDYKAWIAGSDGSRLDMEVGMRGANSQEVSRHGYPFAPPKPRLIVSYKGKNVIDTPVDPLLPPIRAIPLVVPIHPSVALRPTTVGKMLPGFSTGEGSWYEVVGLTGVWAKAHSAHVRRSEWRGGGGGSAPRHPGEPLKLIVPKSAMPEAFAELEIGTALRKRFVRDVELDVEIHNDDGKPKVRVAQAVEVQFPDHAKVKFPVQDPRVQGSQKNGMPGNINLDMQEAAGLPALFVHPIDPSFRSDQFHVELR